MFYDAWKLVCHKPFRYICTCIHQAIESSCAHTQVQQDNSAVELPMVELEKAEKGVKVAESVLAVSSDVKTNFGNSSHNCSHNLQVSINFRFYYNLCMSLRGYMILLHAICIGNCMFWCAIYPKLHTKTCCYMFIIWLLCIGAIFVELFLKAR